MSPTDLFVWTRGVQCEWCSLEKLRNLRRWGLYRGSLSLGEGLYNLAHILVLPCFLYVDENVTSQLPLSAVMFSLSIAMFSLHLGLSPSGTISQNKACLPSVSLFRAFYYRNEKEFKTGYLCSPAHYISAWIFMWMLWIWTQVLVIMETFSYPLGWSHWPGAMKRNDLEHIRCYQV